MKLIDIMEASSKMNYDTMLANAKKNGFEEQRVGSMIFMITVKDDKVKHYVDRAAVTERYFLTQLGAQHR